MFGQIITGKELYDRLQQFIGQDDDLTQQTVAGWLDEAISEFPKIAFQTLRETYTGVLASVEYDLPMDFASIEGLSIYDSTKVSYTSYHKASSVKVTKTDHIVFPEDLATIDLEYNQVQGPYNDLSVELPLRRQLRPVLYYYIVSEYYSKEGEGSPEEERMAVKYLQRYEQRKAILVADLEQRDVEGPVGTTDEMYKKSRSHRGGSRQDFTEYDGNGDVLI